MIIMYTISELYSTVFSFIRAFTDVEDHLVDPLSHNTEKDGCHLCHYASNPVCMFLFLSGGRFFCFQCRDNGCVTMHTISRVMNHFPCSSTFFKFINEVLWQGWCRLSSDLCLSKPNHLQKTCEHSSSARILICIKGRAIFQRKKYW